MLHNTAVTKQWTTEWPFWKQHRECCFPYCTKLWWI